MESLMSGFIGAILAVVLTVSVKAIIFFLRRRALHAAILAECQYNLAIVEEMLDGMVSRRRTFKRMSVAFFKEIREQSVQYFLDKELLRRLSNLIVDLELYNREADSISDCNDRAIVYAGIIGKKHLCVMGNPVRQDLSRVVTLACEGVKNSLNSVIECVI